MINNLSILEYKNILKYYNIQIPKTTLYYIKKKANKVIIKKMCNSNCDNENKYKFLLFILNKHKFLSNNKKNKYEKTKKSIKMKYKKTKNVSPINYLCT